METRAECLDVIFARRSIRRYRPQPVPEDAISRLLEAAMAAPSSANQQPWHFVVVTERATLDLLSQRHPYAGMLKEATLCIVPCGDLSLVPEGLTGEFWTQDVAAATENLLLAATALGLGSVWCGVHPKPQRVTIVRELLGLPDRVVPLCLVAIGYPAEDKPPRTQYQEGRVHRERW